MIRASAHTGAERVVWYRGESRDEEDHVDALEAICLRRSIRQFEQRAVPDDIVATLLKAAMAAPSAFNEQPWQFVVVRDQATRESLSHVSEYAGPMARADVGIVVCGERARLRFPDSVYWIFDCSSAMQNVLIAATSLGLGSVWLGIHPWPERTAMVRQILTLPDEVEPLGMAAIGWPAETKGPGNRFDSSRVHQERW